MRRSLLVAVPLAVLLLADIFVRGLALARATPPAAPTALVKASDEPAASSTAPSTPSPAASATPATTATPSETPTVTATPTITLTPTVTTTPRPPRGLVQVQANCRYGPGAAYLYEWGLYPGDRVDILGRNDLGTWAYVHPWYYVDKCWVNTAVLEVTGDVFSVPPYYGILPLSDLYRPPSGVTAARKGDLVTIQWNAVWMTVDDYRGYLIEAWVCRDRQIVFTPVAIDGTVVSITDEAGCVQPSNGRLYTAEKHGYTAWIRIPWPAYTAETPTP